MKREDFTAKQIGGYAWAMYGALIMFNLKYYYDLYYRSYIVDIFDNRGLAFRTIFGTANYLRITINMTAWGLAGLFWVATFWS